MSKKATTNSFQLLSPENYIRQKVRNLLVHECLINADWNDSKLANVLVARKHTNGNITAGLYLVDLMCLGIKDTQYFFNIDISEYNDIKEKMDDAYNITNISYILAHNIVFTGVEYGAENGFEPSKEFRSITVNILEEDTDEIELIDVECGGKNGKPCYVKGPFENSTKVKQIVSRLEKTLGVGNFDVIEETELDDYFDEDMEEDEFEDEPIDPELLKLSFKKLKKEFFRLKKESKNDFSDTNAKRLMDIVDLLYLHIINEDKKEQYQNEINNDLNFIIQNERSEFITMLGISEALFCDEVVELFFETYESRTSNHEKALRKLASYRKIVGDIASAKYLEMMILQSKEEENYEKCSEALSEAIHLFPDYPLLKIMWFNDQLYERKNKKNRLTDYKPTRTKIFGNRDVLHEFEVFHYLLYYILYLEEENNPTKIIAFETILEELDLTKETYDTIYSFTVVIKLSCITTHL